MATNMPPDLAKEYGEIKNEVMWIFYKWEIYTQLYSDAGTVDLLNEAAPSVFRILQDVVIDDTLISLSRLNDPAKTGRFDNLTLNRLVESIDPVQFLECRTKVQSLINILDKKIDFARSHRNKRIAHSDLQTRLQSPAQPLPDISLRAIQDLLDGVALVLNSIEMYFDSASTSYGHTISPDDGNTLIEVLRMGVKYRQAEWDKMFTNEAVEE